MTKKTKPENGKEEVLAVPQAAFSIGEDKTKYKFLIPKFLLYVDEEIREISAVDALKDPEILELLVKIKSGVIAKVQAKEEEGE